MEEGKDLWYPHVTNENHNDIIQVANESRNDIALKIATILLR